MEEDDEMIQNMSQSDLIRHIASQVQANVARRGAGRGALRGTGRGAGRGAHNASMPRNLFLPITIIKITAVLHHPNGNQEFSEESWGGGIMVKGFVLKKVKDWQLEKAVEPLFVWVEEDGREVDYEEALKPDATYAFHYAHGFDFKYHTVNYVRYNRDLGRDEKPGFPIPQNQRWQRRRETPAPTAPQIPQEVPRRRTTKSLPRRRAVPDRKSSTSL
ncbi:hypothetical protein L596_008642 [Steinernema carpocapsae]|uniref:Uncharacterized protein n=1 Tax=Steinernema carpocapsae TaxID=34508 RepID=A0A4U5PD91_STECR|nr:hypothetical protein L596_008642 [Steinernema carpocapsae]